MKRTLRFFGIAAGLLGCLGTAGCSLKNSETYTQTAVQQITEFEYEEALLTLDKAQQEGENARETARIRGIALAGLTRYEEAAACYEQALAYSGIFPSDMDYDLNYYLAEAYEKMGEEGQAIAVYSNILALRPDEKDAFFLRGRLYLSGGEYEKALTDFNRAMILEKDGYDLRIEIAGLLSGSGHEEEGVKYLQEFLGENEKKLSDFDKGRIYYYMGDYENAKTSLESAKSGDLEQVILLLGKAYEQLGDYNYATSVYKNYLTDHPEAAQIYNQLGLCKLKSEEYEEALSAFRSALNVENNGMERTLEFNQIVAYEYTGDFKQAAVLMESYIKKYPDDEDALREYEFLKTR